MSMSVLSTRSITTTRRLITGIKLSCFRDDSTAAAVAPGAPKKAARPVDKTRGSYQHDHLKAFPLKERDLAAMTEEEQIAYAMQVLYYTCSAQQQCGV